MIDWKQKVLEYIDQTKDFFIEQAPAFVQEIIAYGRALSILYLFVCPIIMCLSSLLIYYSTRERIFNDYGCVKDGRGRGALGAIVGSIIFLTSSIAFMKNVDQALMTWFAPKLYIIKMINIK